MALKQRTCKTCNRSYMPIKAAQPRCKQCTYDWEIEKKVKRGMAIVKKQREIVKKEATAKHKADKEKIKTRTQHYNELQTLVNRYVRLRDKDEPCCTCGTTNSSIKYDAGHMLSRGAHPELRFDLHNIHRQCSRQCNVLGSGMRYEYELFIANKYGQAELRRLKGPHPTLKQQFPNIEDIQNEKIKFRKMIKEIDCDRN